MHLSFKYWARGNKAYGKHSESLHVQIQKHSSEWCITYIWVSNSKGFSKSGYCNSNISDYKEGLIEINHCIAKTASL